MKISSYCFYDSPLGRIMVAEDGDAITQIRFLTEFNYRDLSPGKTVLLEEAGIQLKEYFSGKRKLFDLPVAPGGTAFQSRVWEALLDIPYGQTRSYGQIAQAVGNRKAARAVGMANSQNPISIVIPCHRVIGFNGKLVGYGGGLDRKAYLLELEKTIPE
ncbi:MAG: methylated-DNA--[protein]-cysteine S-methyltransferase [Firmicutes bacterium]|nr:methylated-DNA--[protein]-cysteine S-methyltransferase [Bacillota bacterium]